MIQKCCPDMGLALDAYFVKEIDGLTYMPYQDEDWDMDFCPFCGKEIVLIQTAKDETKDVEELIAKQKQIYLIGLKVVDLLLSPDDHVLQGIQLEDGYILQAKCDDGIVYLKETGVYSGSMRLGVNDT